MVLHVHNNQTGRLNLVAVANEFIGDKHLVLEFKDTDL